MTKGRYGGPDKRRSPRYDRRFQVILEHEGKTYEVRTINISRHGVQIPRRNPPPVESHVKLTITLRNETSIFEGIVKMHTNCLVNGEPSICMGIDIISPGYDEFIKDKILIA